ncbi:MAG: hypothetical protein IJQ76_01210 [Prevotella sp.]|nr:hypothetical protein [Prevotella sp.]
MLKRLFLILFLLITEVPVKAMTDSLLMAEVARTGGVLKQMQFDSTLVQVRRLLPVAQENGNVLAEAALHGIAGYSLSRSNRLQAGMQEYLRSAAIAEQHHLLERAVGEKTGTILALFSTMYGEMSLRYQNQGNQVEALHHARTALRWVSYVNQAELRVGVMSCIMPALAAGREWLPAYDLMKQAFADAIEAGQYDFAVVMAAYLMRCEDECFSRGPGDSPWMRQADSIAPLVATHEAAMEYEGIKQTLVGKYARSEDDKDREHRMDDVDVSLAEPDVVEEKIVTDSVAGTPLTHEDSHHGAAGTHLLLLMMGSAILAFCLYYVWHRRDRRKRQKASERQMAEKYAEGQEYERNRLARELHDGVSNQLLAVEMKLSTEGLTPDTMQLLDESREQVRRVSHELLQPEFSRVTLAEVLANYVAQLDGVRQCSMSFSASPAEADWAFIPPATALDIYRIVQELVANILKHSGATVISVGLHQDGARTIMLLISDNGEDASDHPATSTGIGLRNMKQRAEALGGSLETMRHQYGRVAKLVVCIPEHT